ncbi:MAG: UTP--glucose-1-phosphate uridylyltransferase [Patescibacteria group bacterium]|nr:UTP--glucose-1-phosphate uridylyltransferase [Patescibacteria group bacterium]
MAKDTSRINKAVIAAAGYGTRFLPATKNQPKEMLPIVDKPIIQYLVEDAVEAGIENIIIVTRLGHSALEDHFDSNTELKRVLEAAGKEKYLKEVKKIPMMANYVYVRQKDNLPYGNASPLLAAKHLIDDDESFIFMFGDDLVLSKVSACAQLIKMWEKDPQSNFLAVQEIPRKETNRYGIVKLKEGSENEIESIIEKPSPENAPSTLAQYGRFIFNYNIFNYLNPKGTGKGGELWLADAIADLAKTERVKIANLDGQWLTTGDPLRYLKTTILYALEREELSQPLRKFLKNILS